MFTGQSVQRVLLLAGLTLGVGAVAFPFFFFSCVLMVGCLSLLPFLLLLGTGVAVLAGVLAVCGDNVDVLVALLSTLTRDGSLPLVGAFF